MQKSSAVDVCLEDHLSIVSRVVGRVIAEGVKPWVDRSDLEDVAQMALVEAADKFQDGTCPFGAFAYKTVRGAVLNELKALSVRNRGRSEMPDVEVDREPEPQARPDIYGALAALPPREYRVVMLHFWGNASQAQIAAELGVDQATVSRILKSAKKSLRACINGESQLHT